MDTTLTTPIKPELTHFLNTTSSSDSCGSEPIKKTTKRSSTTKKGAKRTTAPKKLTNAQKMDMILDMQQTMKSKMDDIEERVTRNEKNNKRKQEDNQEWYDMQLQDTRDDELHTQFKKRVKATNDAPDVIIKTTRSDTDEDS